VHSEVLWALNPTNNITEAIQRYGISDGTTALFVVRIGAAEENILDQMCAAVVGTVCPFSALEKMTDWALIRKASIWSDDSTSAGLTAGQYHKLDGESGELDEIVVSTVAMKSVVA